MKSAIAWIAPVCLLVSCAGSAFARPDLEDGFRSPPQQARPHTWWHWMNGNITREGITADLEAMKAVGIGGFQVFNVSESIPEGPISIMSPEWLDLVQFAASEANRLGLEMCMHNCPGWSSSGGPWVKPEQAMQMVVTSETTTSGPSKLSSKLPQPAVHGGFYRDICVLAFPTPKDDATRIRDISVKSGLDYRYGQDPAADQVPVAAVVAKFSVIDLTSKLAADGTLNWDVPQGSWTIVRFGHTLTGAQNAPSPASGRGLECDKLSAEALDAHWAGMMGPVISKLGPLAGKSLNNCLIDSYEMGGQNWTPRFREEFTKRRGYDPLPFLPTLTGRFIDGGATSERFLWDFRRTIADLFADNYYTHFADLCKKNGLSASIEPYDGPFECMLVGRDADIPMGEFWVGSSESASCRTAASVGHTYGRKIIGAESFTAFPAVGKWQNHPGSLKAVGDLMYTVGINRYIIHRYAHQPWATGVVPGMTMGQWGTHFERTNTWWNQSRAWLDYMARCQYLLQEGRFHADVCFLTGDDAPNGTSMNLDLKADGYDSDAINPDVLLRRATVKNGLLTLPDGMSYSVLALPDSPYMTERTLARVYELARQGLKVVGTPPKESPSLSDEPLAIEKLNVTAKGLITPGTALDALKSLNLAPDCTFTNATGKLSWIHRTAGRAHVYFISNQAAHSQEVECTFRVAGLTPEIWHADTGVTEPAPIWHKTGNTTSVTLRLDGSGSAFVVFYGSANAPDHLASLELPEKVSPPKPPAIAIVKATYAATDGAGGFDVTPSVAAMVKSGQTSIPATNSSFGDPAYLHVKQLTVVYTLDGKEHTLTARENENVELIDPVRTDIPLNAFLRSTDHGLELVAFQPGTYTAVRGGGARSTIAVGAVPPPSQVEGPWKISFPPNLGAPPSTTIDSLASWTESKDDGVRYFSGTAEYTRELTIDPALVNASTEIYLDLGVVKDMAQVSLNGTDLGLLWKPPFRVNITSAVKKGANSLSIKITNEWVNRLIGDEQLPEDVEWNGITLARWPSWLLQHTQRPSKRITFTTWHHHTKDSPLMESGLIGPVTIRTAVKQAVPAPDLTK